MLQSKENNAQFIPRHCLQSLCHVLLINVFQYKSLYEVRGISKLQSCLCVLYIP